MKPFRVRFWAYLLLGAAACAYRFSAPGAPLPEGIRSVRSPVLVNNTAEPGLEVLFTQALREELLRSGVRDDPQSDAVLEGTLADVYGGANVAPPGKFASYRINAVADLRLVKQGRVLAATRISGWEDYLPGNDMLQSEANRQAALRRLAQALARDGAARLAQGW